MKENVMGRLGVEVGEAVAAVVRAVADGKVTAMEGVGIGKEILTLGLEVFQNRKELGEGFADGLDAQEAADLHEGFCLGFDPGDTCDETRVEHYFGVALELISTLSLLFMAPRG